MRNGSFFYLKPCLSLDERNELQSFLKRLESRQKELERKKATYCDNVENGKISFDLVAERPEQIKVEVEKNQNLILETLLRNTNSFLSSYVRSPSNRIR